MDNLTKDRIRQNASVRVLKVLTELYTLSMEDPCHADEYIARINGIIEGFGIFSEELDNETT